MEPSRLKLESYHITKISVVPRPDADGVPVGQFADFKNVDVSANVTLHNLAENEGQKERQGLALEFKASPTDGNSFPYTIDMEMVGVFDTDDLPKGRRDVLLLVNGASILYSAMREVLLSITYRCMHGPVMLPSVNFTWLEKQHLEKQATASANLATEGRSAT